MDNLKPDNDMPMFIADEFADAREQDVDADEVEVEVGEASDSDADERATDADSEEGTSSIVIKNAAPEYEKLIYVVPEHVTSDLLSKFEMTNLVTTRISQIALYHNCFVDTQGLTSATEMAKRELMMRKNPLMVRRYVGDRVLADGHLQKCYDDRDPNVMIFTVTY